MPTLDQDRLNAFMGKVVADLGAAMSAPLVLLGDRLGLYKALAAAGAHGLTPVELADKTHMHERYIREWLLNQAASGYAQYDAATGCYSLSPEQAAALADETSPCHVPGGFYIAASMVRDMPKIEHAFKTGEGVDWGEHDTDLFCGTELFFAASYRANLIAGWIPALDGVRANLEKGAEVADVGCGHGASTIIMAKAFPKSRFTGIDAHEPSIACAARAAARAGVADRCSFTAASAAGYPRGTHGYDFITFFDCLHDMGDPVGAAAHARKSLKPDGTAMIVEPAAADKTEDNLHPVGRVYSAASTMICVPASIKHKGPALGAVAGEARLTKVLKEGGFSRVRVATRTPFNMVLEARP